MSKSLQEFRALSAGFEDAAEPFEPEEAISTPEELAPPATLSEGPIAAERTEQLMDTRDELGDAFITAMEQEGRGGRIERMMRQSEDDGLLHPGFSDAEASVPPPPRSPYVKFREIAEDFITPDPSETSTYEDIADALDRPIGAAQHGLRNLIKSATAPEEQDVFDHLDALWQGIKQGASEGSLSGGYGDIMMDVWQTAVLARHEEQKEFGGNQSPMEAEDSLLLEIFGDITDDPDVARNLLHGGMAAAGGVSDLLLDPLALMGPLTAGTRKLFKATGASKALGKGVTALQKTKMGKVASHLNTVWNFRAPFQRIKRATEGIETTVKEAGFANLDEANEIAIQVRSQGMMADLDQIFERMPQLQAAGHVPKEVVEALTKARQLKKLSSSEEAILLSFAQDVGGAGGARLGGKNALLRSVNLLSGRGRRGKALAEEVGKDALIQGQSDITGEMLKQADPRFKNVPQKELDEIAQGLETGLGHGFEMAAIHGGTAATQLAEKYASLEKIVGTDEKQWVVDQLTEALGERFTKKKTRTTTREVEGTSIFDPETKTFTPIGGKTISTKTRNLESTEKQLLRITGAKTMEEAIPRAFKMIGMRRTAGELLDSGAVLISSRKFATHIPEGYRPIPMEYPPDTGLFDTILGIADEIPESDASVANILGLTLRQEAIKRGGAEVRKGLTIYAPKDLGVAFSNVNHIIQGGRHKEGFIRAMDKALQAVKAVQTRYRPGYHVRNVMEDTTRGMITANKPFAYAKNMSRAIDMLTGQNHNGMIKIGGKKVSFKKLYERALDDGVLTTGQMNRDALVSAGVGAKKTMRNRVAGMVAKVTAGYENTNRLATYLDELIANGGDFAGAALKSRRTHYIYEDVTPAFRSMSYIPYFTWMAKKHPRRAN